MKHEVYYQDQCHNMAILGKALRDHLPELQQSGHPKWKEVDLNAVVGDWKRDECALKGLNKEQAAQHVENAPASDSSLQNDLLGVIRGK